MDPQGEAEKMVEEFDRRRRYVYEAIKSMPRVRVVKPQGAFYILPNISGFGKTPEDLAGLPAGQGSDRCASRDGPGRAR